MIISDYLGKPNVITRCLIRVNSEAGKSQNQRDAMAEVDEKPKNTGSP